MKRKRAFAIAGLGLFIGLVVLVTMSAPPDPVYAGRRLSEWLPEVGYSSLAQSFRGGEADGALMAIGTNAIPYIVLELESEDIWGWRKLVETLNERRWNHLNFRTAHDRQIQALVACMVLAKDAADAQSTLLELLTESPEPVIRWNAARALGELGPAAALAVPQLCAVLENDPQIIVRHAAAQALGKIGPAAVVAVPQLIKAVNKGSAVIKSTGWAGNVLRESDGAADALAALGVTTNAAAKIRPK